MQFRIADSFQTALRRLAAQEQKAVKETVYDLQTEPSALGLQFHRSKKSRTPKFWSIRAIQNNYIDFQKTGDSSLFCNVGHHYDGYDWALVVGETSRIFTRPLIGRFPVKVINQINDEVMKAFAV
jgi:hypothetical protein